MEQVHLYRHDEIVIPRPYACDVDGYGWLWEGTTENRLLGHNIHSGELRVVEIPEMEGEVVFSAFAWREKVFLIFGDCAFYVVYDPSTGQVQRYRLPGEKALCWYGCKLPNGKLMLFDRRAGHALLYDAPDAAPDIVPCPWEGDLANGSVSSDGLVYIFLADPARLVRFDPMTQQFMDQPPLPWPEAVVTGRFEHKGVLYCADSVGGRLFPLDLQTQQWGEPIKHPDYGKVFGFIGIGFGFEGKGYFSLSTYTARSRLDLKTGKIIISDTERLSVDDLPYRFMERFLVFDAETQTFEYLVAPEQPDGLPLLCYYWVDEKQFAITGFVILWGQDGEPLTSEPGPWLILQSQPADE